MLWIFPPRFFAEKLFHGKRGFAIVLSYICFIGVVAALIGLVVPPAYYECEQLCQCAARLS